MNKRDIIIYRVVTGLFTLHMLFTIAAYFFMYDMVRDMFEALGFSAGVIYPLAAAKFLGLIAIWSNKSRILKELAYAGFAIDFMLAISSHLIANHGEFVPALVALVMLIISYIYHRKITSSLLKSAESV